MSSRCAPWQLCVCLQRATSYLGAFGNLRGNVYCRASAVSDLSSEAYAHQDLLVVRGLETYKNLPNKSLRLMRYALSNPAGYAPTGPCAISACAKMLALPQ